MAKKVVLDTNVIQALYMILNLDDGVERLRKGYNEEQINSLIKLSKNLSRFNFYVTAQIFKEVNYCEMKYPGIIDFMSKICKIEIPNDYSKNSRILKHVLSLQKEYLKKDIYLRDRTRAAQQAIGSEMKDGVENYADSLIVSQKNVISGYPMFTLNEQHLVCMNEAKRKTHPYRSKAILFKNKKYIEDNKIEDAKIKANIEKETATTYKINRIFDDEYIVK